ncbi:MAG: extracellular solute-binding protein [Actinobacteria bacterium]|nr:extracellular solute-binding protein [Actinomycetota bacterium]
MKVLIVALLSLATFAFILNGCAPAAAPSTEGVASTEESVPEETTPPETEQPKLSGSIKVVVSPDMALKGLQAKTEEFSKITGVEVDYNEVGWDVYFQSGPIDIQSGEYVWDVMDVNEGWIQDFGAVANLLLPLDDLLADEIKDVAPALIKSGTRADHVYGFPFLPSWQIFFINADLFKEAGLDPQNPPRTWDEFHDALTKLNKDTDNDGEIDQYAYIVSWGEELGVTFQFHQWQKAAGGERYEWKDGKVHFLYNTPESAKALEFMKKLWDDGLVSPDTMTGLQQDVTPLFASGTIPILTMWDMYVSYVVDPESSKIIGKLDFMPFPGIEKEFTAAMDGHEFLAIPKNAKNVDAAVAYIKYVASKENTGKRSLEEFVDPVYEEQWNDPEVQKALPFLDVVQFVSNFEVDQFPPVKSSQELDTFAGAQMMRAILGDIGIEEALKIIQEKADTFETVEGMTGP